MQIATKIPEIQNLVAIAKSSGKKIALIPTMGALHDGHLALIDAAKKHAEFVVVSIFINKTQFNDISDYQKYPKTHESDIAKLRAKSVDALFLPDDQEIFPEESSFEITPKKLASILCGAHRSGHFQGVCLIITKLFNITKPDFAIFGKKDFQQFLIIEKLARDFNFDTKIIGLETIRENSGLAMSSRNQRLGTTEKQIATKIFAVLNEIKNEVKNAGNIKNILKNKAQILLDCGFDKVDYLQIRDEKNLELIEEYDPQKPCRIFIAAHLSQIRLIDNLKI